LIFISHGANISSGGHISAGIILFTWPPEDTLAPWDIKIEPSTHYHEQLKKALETTSQTYQIQKNSHKTINGFLAMQ
ncbi:hypothetical protein Goklo_005032, partial [Gossypium klotzschianum]|nr:hypothetical protein [Gossypium klotzschianum]